MDNRNKAKNTKENTQNLEETRFVTPTSQVDCYMIYEMINQQDGHIKIGSVESSISGNETKMMTVKSAKLKFGSLKISKNEDTKALSVEVSGVYESHRAGKKKFFSLRRAKEISVGNEYQLYRENWPESALNIVEKIAERGCNKFIEVVEESEDVGQEKNIMKYFLIGGDQSDLTGNCNGAKQFSLIFNPKLPLKRVIFPFFIYSAKECVEFSEKGKGRGKIYEVGCQLKGRNKFPESKKRSAMFDLVKLQEIEMTREAIKELKELYSNEPERLVFGARDVQRASLKSAIKALFIILNRESAIYYVIY
ncbi:expressed protein [Phakopsora pachyrhizi]|uniref:Expressed protein n=1 Tax=Phakopsora pachyrhizi TaxID=170000 RepID=A0AAV0BU01_PHAPC|nr:expressed protein [Phakopsora pachyrhizi]CAH7690281.1 expressed protein [Phakopsora pachyrhizi]CAH7690282.1 expressed protein [Phakopsora pachyrhizi]